MAPGAGPDESGSPCPSRHAPPHRPPPSSAHPIPIRDLPIGNSWFRITVIDIAGKQDWSDPCRMSRSTPGSCVSHQDTLRGDRTVFVPTAIAEPPISRIVVRTPRIEQPNVKPGEVPDIPRHEDQLVLNGDRSDLGICCGGTTSRTVSIAHEASPYGSRAAVERQNSSFELPDEVLLDPSLEACATLMLPDLPSASNKLPNCLSGEKEIRRTPGLQPFEDSLPGSWPYRLADNVGALKEGHQPSLAERPADLSRSMGGSISVKGEARRKASSSAPVCALGAISTDCSDR